MLRDGLGDAVTDAGPAVDLVEVCLLGVPVSLHLESRGHISALQREMELIRRSDSDDRTVPARLQALLDELAGELGQLREEAGRDLQAAVERGDATVDLRYRVPTTAGVAARRLSDLLDEADELSRAGHGLLTVVSSPQATRYRRWFLGELERQVGGHAPRPWDDLPDGEPTDDDDGQPPIAEPPAPARVALPAGWSLHRAGGAATVVVAGPVDLESAPALRAALVELVTSGSRVSVDLTGCDFLDSVGVSVLLAATAHADELGAALSLRVGSAASRVLGIAGLLDRLPIEA